MGDSKEMRDGRDRSRINVEEDYELQYWSEQFGVTQNELKSAVESVGVDVKDVEEYLSRESR